MESATLIHMEPSLPMLAEAFPQGELHCREPERYFRDIRLFNRDTRADPNVLYLVLPEDAAMFPGESCAGICQVPLKGDCLVLPRMEIADIFNAAMTIYDRCRDQEGRLDQLVFQGSSLKELCEEAAILMGNPVYIHDDWFMMLAQSAQVEEVMPTEYPANSQKGYLPRDLIDDLQFDSDYMVAHKKAVNA